MLNMMYFGNFASPRSELSSYGNPLSKISNCTSMINIGFSNEDLCKISHDDLSIDLFSRVNFYNMPQVLVSTFGSENGTPKTTVRSLSVNFYENST